MNILVIGCGKVGSRLASMLSREGYDVSVVDRDETSFLLLDDDYSGLTTAGVPIDQDVLKRAGIESCDAVAAVSQDDNVNIMVSQLAREIFKVPKVLARIFDTNREDVFSHFGLHTICPTNLTVEAAKTAIIEPHKPQQVQFGCHTVSFITVDLPKHLVGENASHLDFEENQTLFAVLRKDFSMIYYKEGMKLILQEEDKLIVSQIVD